MTWSRRFLFNRLSSILAFIKNEKYLLYKFRYVFWVSVKTMLSTKSVDEIRLLLDDYGIKHGPVVGKSWSSLTMILVCSNVKLVVSFSRKMIYFYVKIYMKNQQNPLEPFMRRSWEKPWLNRETNPSLTGHIIERKQVTLYRHLLHNEDLHIMHWICNGTYILFDLFYIN